MVIVNRVSADIESRGGVRIAVEYAGPATPEALIVLCHGVCEHRGRYQRLVERCCHENLATIAFDLRGHGTSSGKRGHVESFDAYLENLQQVTRFRNALVERFGIRGNSFLFGHSLGGVIVTRYLQEQGKNAGYSGVILSSPGFVTAVPIPAYKRALSFVAQGLCPTFLVPTGLAVSAITTDLDEQRAYAADPKVTQKVSLRWFREFERSGQVALGRAREITLPLYAFYGSSDSVVSTATIERFVEATGVKDKTIRRFEGLRHETLSEQPEARERVTLALLAWIRAHL